MTRGRAGAPSRNRAGKDAPRLTAGTGADLVAEVVSPDNPGRDLVEKRIDYAEAGIPEYWIADPRDETITVLSLWEDAYVEHGVFVRGDTATSPLLEGFAVDVTAVFDAPPANVRRAGT